MSGSELNFNMRNVLRLLPAVIRATWELALSRLRHLTLTPAKIEAGNLLAQSVDKRSGREVERTVELVAYVTPRVAARLPWRSDCLIQAMAAQRWLMTKDIGSSISIGVHLPAPGEFQAHAWLKHEGRIVTGGDISSFSPIFTGDRRPGTGSAKGKR